MTERSESVRSRLALYGVTVFLSSAVLLVLEIAAGRLIAPYVGVSLYSWTSIIGVILAGLSLGNWLGGRWADRGGAHGAAAAALASAGLATLAVLLVLTLVAPLIQTSRMNLLGASFLFVLSLFFVPAVLLGVVTPLLTSLALALDSRSGHVVGRMHALAALGSIAGTFAAGYWLVQYFGTRTVLLISAATLFSLALPFFRSRHRAAGIAVVAGSVLVVAATHLRQGFANPCTRESQYYCIRVEDASFEVPFGRARALVLDHLVHGVNHESEPGMLVAPYTQLVDELVLLHLGSAAGTARYFFLGGGAYTLPRSLHALAPSADITVAEIDPLVTRTAAEHLYLSVDGIRILHTDARVALGDLGEERFDVIVGDVIHDIAMPYHLMTREFAELIKRRLYPHGLYVLNVVDAFPDPLLVKSVVKTLRETFRHVDVWLEFVPTAPARLTYIVSAADVAPPPRTIRAQRGFERQWERVTGRLLDSGTPPQRVPTLVDDYVPVERLVGRLLTTGLGQ